MKIETLHRKKKPCKEAIVCLLEKRTVSIARHLVSFKDPLYNICKGLNVSATQLLGGQRDHASWDSQGTGRLCRPQGSHLLLSPGVT